MESVLPGPIDAVLSAVAPDRSGVQRRMEARAVETDFPVVGPEVGGLLGLLTRIAGARRVFEFGSGFGYSATWFAEALPADGLVVLTELDADKLELARDYFEEAGLADRAAFEEGDAFETFERYEGPFDVVLVDCEKDRYPDAIEAIEPKLDPGGLVVADNALAAGYSVDDIAAGFEKEPTGEWAAGISGIVEYLDRMADDRAFDTSVIPLGEGVAVSRYRGRA